MGYSVFCINAVIFVSCTDTASRLEATDKRCLLLCYVNCLFHRLCLGWLFSTLRGCDLAVPVYALHPSDGVQSQGDGLDGHLALLVGRQHDMGLGVSVVRVISVTLLRQ